MDKASSSEVPMQIDDPFMQTDSPTKKRGVSESDVGTMPMLVDGMDVSSLPVAVSVISARRSSSGSESNANFPTIYNSCESIPERNFSEFQSEVQTQFLTLLDSQLRAAHDVQSLTERQLATENTANLSIIELGNA